MNHLLLDLVGTKAAFGIYNSQADVILHREKYPTSDLPSLETGIANYMNGLEEAYRPAAAAMALPGVVKSDTLMFSNIPQWNTPLHTLRNIFPHGLSFLNDVETLGWLITDDTLHTTRLMGPHEPSINPNRRIVYSMGTGANRSLAMLLGKEWVVLDGEFGQIYPTLDKNIFPDRAELEDFLTSKSDKRLRLEMFTSGSALPWLYAYQAGEGEAFWTSEEIIHAATKENNPDAQAVIRMVTRTAGYAIATMASEHMVSDIYITGGMIDHVVAGCADNASLHHSLVTNPMKEPLRRRSNYAGVNAIFEAVRVSHIREEEPAFRGLVTYIQRNLPQPHQSN